MLAEATPTTVAITVATIGAASSITAAWIGAAVARGVKRNRVYAESLGAKIETGNGIDLGPTVHRIDQTLEFVATAVKSQGEAIHAQAATLDRGTQRFTDIDLRLRLMSDSLNDQRIEQETFVTKVTPLCDWVERKQQEEGKG